MAPPDDREDAVGSLRTVLLRPNVKKPLVAALTAALALGVGSCAGPGGGPERGPEGVTADAERGRELFQANCAACHGPQGEGTAAGPPLVHELYVPSHHSDESFHVAVQRGVQPHHWDFGAMPPVPGLDREDVDDVVAYVRQLQREAGVID